MRRMAFVFIVIAALLWIWPNLVHEPFHALALELQGIDYQIAFDWSSWPAQPTITRLGAVGGVFGGLFFLLLPSLMSVVLLFVLLWLAKINKVSLMTHVALPAYLAFDLIVNVMKWHVPTSDFGFFVAVPYAQVVAIGIAVCVGGLAGLVIMTAAPTTLNTTTTQHCAGDE